jgi:hypothetical protein
MHALFALVMLASPGAAAAVEAAAYQGLFLGLVALAIFNTAKNRWRWWPLIVAVTLGGLLGLLLPLADGSTRTQILIYIWRHESAEFALLCMLTGWLLLEMFGPRAFSRPLPEHAHSQRASTKHIRTATAVTLIFSAFNTSALAFICFTIPSNRNSHTFWLDWQETLRWDWWLRERILLSILCAPFGMLASYMFLGFVRRFWSAQKSHEPR